MKYWEELLINSSSNNNTASIHVVACDLRGYSIGASPDGIEQYTYDTFLEDTFAIADSAFGEGIPFHLMGHDHGAALAWYIAANDFDGLLESLVTLSVPHIGLLSDALCGNNTDLDQIVASNYFNQFSLPDSATLNDAALTGFFQSIGLPVPSPEDFQKLLWWYHGSSGSAFSMPRVVSDQEVQEFGERFSPEAAFFVEASRQVIPLEERECIPGDYETEDLVVDVPTLFICGLNDFALLCNNPYATNFDPTLIPDYEHSNFQCGHDFFLEGQCATLDESQAVMDKITSFVLPELLDGTNFTATPSPTGTDTPIDPTTTEAPSTTSTPEGTSGSNVAPLTQTVVILMATFASAFAW